METKNIRKVWDIMKLWYMEIKGKHVDPNPWTKIIIRINYKKKVSHMD